MGTWRVFKCDKCGYLATVSGGWDRGMTGVFETMICHSCDELVDVRIGDFWCDCSCGDVEEASNLRRCPKCSNSNLTVWQAPWLCPKCSGKMIKGKILAKFD